MYEKPDVSEEVLERLPDPSGYRLLIAALSVSEKTAGGVIRPDEIKDRESTASLIGYVLKAGPDAYTDTDKFPTGGYAKVGDFVMFRAYSGTRFKVGGSEFRIINDDTVEATVSDPRGYERV